MPNVRCSECDTLFNSLMDLEHHKEELQHWSEEEEEEEGEMRTSRKYLLSVSGSHFLADQSMSAGSFNYSAKYRVQVTAVG